MAGRRRRVAGFVAVVALIAGVAACAPRTHHPAAVPRGPIPAPDEEHLAWAENEPVFVVVRKSCRTLDVYFHGDRVRTYPAVFGIGGSPDKLYEGDHRTPNGLYAIVEKRPHPRWRWFFLLDYPNGTDWQRYWAAVAGGGVPNGAGVGGAVGIHGTDKPDLNSRGVDWTWGCVSVDNESIDDLADLLPVGTPVLIQD